MNPSNSHDDTLGRLAEHLQALLDDGTMPPEGTQARRELAERFGVADAEVTRLVVALEAMRAGKSMGAGLGSPETDVRTLSPPQLPEDYELGAELGRGGMGIVYRARQKSLARDVAVKVLRPGDLMFGDAIARFEREAKSLARLRHRHIVSVHEVGNASGFVYFTMDLITGMSLEQLIARGQMTNTRTVKLLRQIASAIRYAHGQGVVHRDLKPANILVDENDDAFVVDFGLARDQGGNESSNSSQSTGSADSTNRSGSNRTISGQMLGTPAYMSPEQALGDRARIGEPADIYALGAILYECLTGKRPFHGLPLARLMSAVLTDDPVPPRKLSPKVPEDLEIICQTAMQKQIEHRYATVQAFEEDLERYAKGREIHARRRPAVARAARALHRNRKKVLAATVPAILLLVLGWLFVVPMLLSGRDLRLAEQLFAEGNEAAALVAYEAAFADDAALDAGLAIRSRYAHCLINEAARCTLTRPRNDARRDLLLARARSILSDFGDRREPFRQLAATEHAAEYEWARLESVQGKFFNPQSLPQDLLASWAERDFTGPGRHATLLLFAQWFANTGAPPFGFDKLACRAAIELIKLGDRLPKSFRERRGGRIQPGFGTEGQYLEALLVDLIDDESQPQSVRWEAGAMLNESDTLPFSTRTVPGTAMASVEHVDWKQVTETWRSLQTMPRADRYRTQIGFVAEQLFRDPRPRDPRASQPWNRMQRWLEARTGIFVRDAEQWRAWWRTNRDRDPRTWLLDSLQWDVAPDDLTTTRLLERLRQPRPKNRPNHGALHFLLALTVDETVTTPIYRTQTDPVAWEQLLDGVPKQAHDVRVATIAFVNGSPTPQLLWQKQVGLEIDETLHETAQVGDALDLPDAHVVLGRGRSHFRSGIELQIDLAVRWERQGPRCVVHVQPRKWYRTYSTQAIYPRHGHGEIGDVFAAGADLFYPASGQSVLEVLTLAVATPKQAASSDREPWSLTEWQQALEQTVRRQARSDAADLGLMTIASFLPLPGVADELEQVDRTLRKTWGDTYRDFGRCARMLAGDVRAITEPPTPPRDDVWATHPDRSPTFWTRLVLTSAAPELRAEATRRLMASTPLHALGEALATSERTGTRLPAELASMVRNHPTRFGQLLHGSMGPIVALLTALFALLIAGRGTFGAPHGVRRRVHAAIVFVAAAVLSHGSVWIAETEWNPAWLWQIVAVVAVWRASWRIIPHWIWMLPALYWTAATVADATVGLPPPLWALVLVPAAMVALQAQRLRARAIRRRIAAAS